MTRQAEEGTAQPRSPLVDASVESDAPRPPLAEAGQPWAQVVCLGNTLMGDDGVAAAVARELSLVSLPPGVAVEVRAYADMGLVRPMRESDLVVFVDALDVGEAPGSVFRFTPDDVGLTKTRTHNSHGMGIGYAVNGARLLGADPNVVVYGIQVADVRPRPDTLSPDVQAVVHDVAEMVAEELRREAASRTRTA